MRGNKSMSKGLSKSSSKKQSLQRRLPLKYENSTSLQNVFQAKRVRFPCGGNFEEMVKQADVFVDKTMLIAEILNFPSAKKIIIITRPQGFGKSTNLSMLRAFFEKKVDKQGKAFQEQPLRYLFEGGKQITRRNGEKMMTQPLAIARDK